jgi:hypothetical protein
MPFYGKCIGCSGYGHNVNMCKNASVIEQKEYYLLNIQNISKKENIYKYFCELSIQNIRLIGSIHNINSGLPIALLIAELTNLHYYKNRKKRIYELNNMFKFVIDEEYSHPVNFECVNSNEIIYCIHTNITNQLIIGIITDEDSLIYAIRIINCCYDVLLLSNRYSEFTKIIEKIIIDICCIFVNQNIIINTPQFDEYISKIKNKKYRMIQPILLYANYDIVYNPLQNIPINNIKSIIECPICLTNKNNESCIMTECGHTFCSNCFITMIDQCNLISIPNCALCRKNIKSIYTYSTDIYNIYIDKYVI